MCVSFSRIHYHHHIFSSELAESKSTHTHTHRVSSTEHTDSSRVVSSFDSISVCQHSCVVVIAAETRVLCFFCAPWRTPETTTRGSNN